MQNMGIKKERDYLFDNYKVVLILLVVIGHFIEPCYHNHSFLYYLKWWIVSFHMPAFIFISGYFSKRNLSPAELIRRLAIPYIIYECIYYLVYTFIIHKPTKLYLLYPKFSLWYLLALLIWRAVTPYVKRIPHHMALSIVAGLLIGCSDMKDNYLSLPRILVFYPFFLAGIHFTKDSLIELKHHVTKWKAWVAVIGITALLPAFSIMAGYSPKIFYGRYNYTSLHQSMLEGISVRILCYAVGFGMTFAMLLILSERKCFYSYIGARTMAIYLFHGLTYSVLKGCTDWLEHVNTIGEIAALLAGCVLLTAVFSIPALTRFTNQIASFHMPEIPVYRKNQRQIPNYTLYQLFGRF